MTVEWLTLSSSASSRVVVRGSASDDGSQLVVVNFRRPVTALLTFRALLSFAKLLEPPLRCACVSSSWAKCIVNVVHCLQCFTTHFELE